MRHLARGVVCAAVMALTASGCSALKSQSEFDYSAGAGETAQLVMPEPLRIKGVDGQATSLPVLLKYPYTVSLAAGQHTVAFQYGQSWGVGQNSELVRGPIMKLDLNARSGERIEINYERPESIDKLNRAEDYVDNFSAWAVDSQGQRVDAVSTGDFGGLGKRLLAGFNDDKPAVDAETKVRPAPVAVQQNAADTDNERLQSLQQLWQTATNEDKKAFMQWVVAPGS